jgi:hypothetical protein
MKLTTHNRDKLTKLFGKCTVGWKAVETCVITCDLAVEQSVKDYLRERGYFVTERQHPWHNGAVDLTRISVTGERELT